MNRIVLATALAACAALTGPIQARNSDWGGAMRGDVARLTCAQFNKLDVVRKDRAMNWALGYVSGMATSAVENSKGDGTITFPKIGSEKMLQAAITKRCKERPSVPFPLVVEWVYAEN